MRFWLPFLMLLMTAGPVFSQRRPVPRVVGAENLPTDRKAQEALRNLRDLEVRRTRERSLQDMQAIYGKPTKQATEILVPDQALLAPYSSFLKLKDTGAIKLNANDQCGQNSEVVSSDEECLKYKIPGGGTAYSFRYNTYRIQRLADLILQKNVIKTDGVLQQGIMVDLGDVPVETLDVASKGLSYLVKFKPAATKFALEKMDKELLTGIEADGHLYRMGFYVEKGHTYALRSVAFEGTSMRTQNGTPYDELTYDKRQDVLVVFRVVGIDTNGNVTIVWRALERNDAPKLDT